MSFNPGTCLLEIFNVAVAAADPANCVPENLPSPPKGRTIVVGAGKASAKMAKIVEENWIGKISGLVVTQYGYGIECNKIKIIEAAHPVPDFSGLEATKKIFQLAKSLEKDDMMLALFSGGGSALLTMPVDGITLSDKQKIIKSLLHSGASIAEINCIRKHLSKIKGGQLAKAASKGVIVSLLISDVVGNDPSTIASGPTVPDQSTFSEAKKILNFYKINVPPRIVNHLESAVEETPKPENPLFLKNDVRVIAVPNQSLKAAAKVGEKLGFSIHCLGDHIEGESRLVGQEHAQLALACKKGLGPVKPPCILLSGGETTVSISGKGRGGPNTEYLMGILIELGGEDGIYAIACDTDGIDGSEKNAGAIITPDSLDRAEKLGLNARLFLQENDAFSFFEKLGDLIETGPTCTNVNDFRAVMILSGS